MCPPTSIWTGALALVSWAGRGMPWAARGDTGERVKDRRDMLLPSCGTEHTTRSQQCTQHTTHTCSTAAPSQTSPPSLTPWAKKKNNNTYFRSVNIYELPFTSTFRARISSTPLIKRICIAFFSPPRTGGEERMRLINKHESGRETERDRSYCRCLPSGNIEKV